MPTSIRQPPPDSAFFNRPLRGVADGEAETGLNDLGRPENYFTEQPGAFEIVQFKVHAITDGQLFPGLFGLVNHLLAFFHGDLHRFFAEHVLARAEGFDGVISVQTVRRDDIDHVNVGIVRHFIHGVVVVNVFVGDIVLSLPAFRFLGMTGDDAGKLAKICLLQCGRNLVGVAQAAQAHQGEAEFFARGLCVR